MKNKNNIKLFYYGIRASLLKLSGTILLLIGIVFLFFNIIISIIFFIFGFILLFKGSSERFDYQRQSGSIIHKGDF